MGLGNLLFGKRRQFNGDVDRILTENLKIDTNSVTNPAFPGALFYLGLLDNGWHNKCSAEETAASIAIGLFIGTRDRGNFKSSNDMIDMRNRIFYFVIREIQAGNIRKKLLDAAKNDIGLSPMETKALSEHADSIKDSR